MRVTPELREYAETPDRFAVVNDDIVQRFADDRVCILQGPTWASVSGVATGDVEALVREVRERVPAEKEPVWWIGPHESRSRRADTIPTFGSVPAA